MSGGSFVGLILLSMAWLFFAGGVVMNFSVAWRRRRAKEGEPVASGIALLPGIVGSLAVFFTIPALGHYGVEVSWPWLWILLPIFLECMVWLSLHMKHRGSR